MDARQQLIALTINFSRRSGRCEAHMAALAAAEVDRLSRQAAEIALVCQLTYSYQGMVLEYQQPLVADSLGAPHHHNQLSSNRVAVHPFTSAAFDVWWAG